MLQKLKMLPLFVFGLFSTGVFAAGVDYAPLLNSVDFSNVASAIVSVGALIMVALVALKAIKFIASAVR